ncbi:MAG TPA: hypothetical protein VKB09_02120, partial [Thermomicrobiales bacterium]|nr:hypothetical protein [Thermomicrobiales bacterium]
MEFDLLRLQRAAGNQAVQRLIVAHGGGVAAPGIQRSPKKKKPVTKVVYVAPSGFISATPAADQAIGYLRGDGPFVTPGAVEATQAVLGKMVFADGNEVLLLKVERVDVGAAPDGAPAGDPAKGTTPQTVTFSGKQFGIPFSGGWIPTKVIDLAGKGQPVAPKDLPANFQAKLGAGSRVELDDGRVWVLMTFPTGGAPLDALTWAPSRDSRKDYKSREATIAAEAAKLPADLKTEVDKHLKIISLVGLVEGEWGSTSIADDPMASLGIFQWGMEKKGKSLGSLGTFFKTLKSRATVAEAKPQATRTETEKLYVDAWHQCVAADLDVSGNQVKIGGKVATGGEVEQKMKGAMATGALKTYQLVGAMDWLEDVKTKTVRPGLAAVESNQIGGGYKDVSAGAAATFKVGKRTIQLTAPADRATVGDLCSTPKTLGAAANLLVNRPAWVELSIWKILAGADASSTADTLLAQIVAAQDAAEAQAAATAPPAPAPTTKKPKGQPKPPPLVAIDAANVVDKTSFEALRRLVWPKATTMSETALVAAFNAQALALYKVEDDAAKKKGQKR